MDIWLECGGLERIKPIRGVLYRLVESQEQVATVGYVDSLEEQAVLEELLEGSKPAYPGDLQSQPLHYLLKTPFRYPPLPWGSRFGRNHEPSLFYGGKSLEVTLAETAYYRFVFIRSIEGTPPAGKLNTEHTVFSVGYETDRGIALHESPFTAFAERLTHKTDYSITQILGSQMRASGVQAFEYVSARSGEMGLCGALFTPAALTDRSPRTSENWLCELTQHRVAFKAVGRQQVFSFSLDDFTVDGALPLPA